VLEEIIERFVLRKKSRKIERKKKERKKERKKETKTKTNWRKGGSGSFNNCLNSFVIIFIVGLKEAHVVIRGIGVGGTIVTKVPKELNRLAGLPKISWLPSDQKQKLVKDSKDLRRRLMDGADNGAAF